MGCDEISLAGFSREAPTIRPLAVYFGPQDRDGLPSAACGLRSFPYFNLSVSFADSSPMKRANGLKRKPLLLGEVFFQGRDFFG